MHGKAKQDTYSIFKPSCHLLVTVIQVSQLEYLFNSLILREKLLQPKEQHGES